MPKRKTLLVTAWLDGKRLRIRLTSVATVDEPTDHTSSFTDEHEALNAIRDWLRSR